ncbi:MAG: glycosyltransferase family 2 protein [Actinobacteria bacterium]|nr:glycosyltransferase family 2 protein [Actinomycetota bacterium]
MMRVEPAKFTVVIPTYNRADLVLRAVRSVLNQAGPQPEIVVVDDGSTDRTAAAVAALEDPRVLYRSQTRAGGTAARNTGAAASGGSFIAFLDDDDELLPGWSSTLASLAARDQSCAIVSCAGLYVDLATDRSRIVAPRDKWNGDGSQAALFDSGAFAVRADVFSAVGGYVPGLPSGPHHELAMRLLPMCERDGLAVLSTAEPLVRINQRRDEDRERSLPRNLYHGALYKLENHRAWLERHPVAWASVLKVAGENATRLGLHGAALRHFAAAVRADPRRLGGYKRLLSAGMHAVVDPLRRQSWN